MCVFGELDNIRCVSNKSDFIIASYTPTHSIVVFENSVTKKLG